MLRAFDLARLGAGRVSPNPMVGAVLVCEDRIIGEGFHRAYGEAHAEVMAVRSVRTEDRPLLRRATLYVSLEPCCIFGRTPPCTDLIRKEGIPRVVISQRDLTPGVNGRGIALLREAGIEVTEHILPAAGLQLSLPRQLFAARERPLVRLKFARSADGQLAPSGDSRYWITHALSRRWVHRLRTETGAILVGANTVRRDDPELTARFFPGPHPLRLVFSPSLALPAGCRLFTGPPHPVVVYYDRRKAFPDDWPAHVSGVGLDTQREWIPELLRDLHRRKINHLTVEGGARLLASFIAGGDWDEALELTGTRTYFGAGLRAPRLPGVPVAEWRIVDDLVRYYRNPAYAEFGPSQERS
jgi:diaminohydroxyphosphoribosylaminopyrimidine deaminase / 5-amino-6-(5-phosphoribosylamino)uracil reductase